MGNLFTRKLAASDELDDLSKRMQSFRKDIELTVESRRAILWYLSLVTFFIASTASGYFILNQTKREFQVLGTIVSFIGGLIFLWIGRRLTNMWYDYRLQKKQKGLDGLIERKKHILENVKEKETFKVACEILEKYGDEEEMRLTSKVAKQQPPPGAEKNVPGGTPMLAGAKPPQGPPRPFPQQSPTNPSRPPMPTQTPIRPQGGQVGLPRVQPTTPMGPAGPVQRRPPVRPILSEPQGAVDKLVDYFFNDGPSNRMALICTQCHGHNGMAMLAEFDYLAFLCCRCGSFNPARKLRQMTRPTPPGGSTTNTERSNTPEPTKKGASPHKDSEENLNVEDVPASELAGGDSSEESFDEVTKEELPSKQATEEES